MTETWSLAQYRAHLAGSGQAQSAPTPVARPARRDAEYDEQVRFFAVIAWLATRYPDRAGELEDVYATSGLAHRSRRTAGRMKDAGQRRGVLDIEVWVPRGRWHALAIELKPLDRGQATSEQTARMDRLNARGYRAVLHHGWIAALTELCTYLDIPLPPNPEGVADDVLARRAVDRRLARQQRRSRTA